MNIKNFYALSKIQHPLQMLPEYQCFLEFIEAYFKNRGIRHPVIVELGVGTNYQKCFYEEFLEAEHIGIDFRPVTKPDILGNTHDEETLAALKEKLNNRAINLLFIDAGHRYEDAKKDYEMYEPMTKNIVAFHDVRHDDPRNKGTQVTLLWEEIMRKGASCGLKMIFAFRYRYEGIGVIVKEQGEPEIK